MRGEAIRETTGRQTNQDTIKPPLSIQAIQIDEESSIQSPNQKGYFD